jgi:hypothetical protein
MRCARDQGITGQRELLAVLIVLFLLTPFELPNYLCCSLARGDATLLPQFTIVSSRTVLVQPSSEYVLDKGVH